MTLVVAIFLSMSASWAQRVPFIEVPREIAKDDLARDAFRLGLEAFTKGDYAKAEESFKTIPELGGFLSLYTHWFSGQIYYNQKKWQEAIPQFEHVVNAKSASDLKYQAQYFLGNVAMERKKWQEAEQRFAKLERKWRRAKDYPELLYKLTATELKLKRPAQGCKWLKKLFVKHPASSRAIAWTNLNELSVGEDKISCQLSTKEYQDRFRQLQLSGESEKARTELLAMQQKASPQQKPAIDMMLANFLVNEGLVDDALNQIVRYYPEMKSDFSYLMLLGKAAARAGEYQTAVGAFEKAYKLSPKSRKGREALFQAAYLSYQFQDYDGAVRKFDLFIKQQPRSGLAKDAQWHLAWLRYLRGDYKGALERFEVVRKGINPKKASSFNLLERLAYWNSMAKLRLNQLLEAKAGFETIAQKNPYTYYGIAAQARLSGIKDALPSGDRGPTSSVSGESLVASAPPQAPVAGNGEEEESEEVIGQNSEETFSEDGAGEEEDQEIIQASEFKDPLLRSRIEIAQKLIELGLPELAKWEMWEVERRTRNPQYLKMLISAYEKIGLFNRSASISELNMIKERESLGLDGARAMWVAMYPQAYKASVQKGARNPRISSELIWSILRTESLYKADVVSPVGARGLMQIMPNTARNLMKLNGKLEFDTQELFKPDVNIALGSQYLSRLSKMFNGSLPLISAAYNAGPHRVENWLIGFGHLEADEFIEHIPFMETRNYVKRVARSYAMYRRLYSNDSKASEMLAKPLGASIPSRPSARESWESL